MYMKIEQYNKKQNQKKLVKSFLDLKINKKRFNPQLKNTKVQLKNLKKTSVKLFFRHIPNFQLILTLEKMNTKMSQQRQVNSDLIKLTDKLME